MKIFTLKTIDRIYIVPIEKITYFFIDKNNRGEIRVGDVRIEFLNKPQEIIDIFEDYYKQKIDTSFFTNSPGGSGPYGSKTFMANQADRQRGV